MILPNERITATSLKRRVRRLNTKNLTGGIRDIDYQNNLESSIPLIADLRID